MSAEPFTGRTHQIRVHALALGHPLAGDSKYGSKEHNQTLRSLGLKRLFLHAHSLSWFDEMTGNLKKVTAPLPLELDRCLKNLHKC